MRWLKDKVIEYGLFVGMLLFGGFWLCVFVLGPNFPWGRL